MRDALRAGTCIAALLAAPCLSKAADVALAPPPMSASLLWTGFYAGVHLANAWTDHTWRDGTGVFENPFRFVPGSGNGAVGGGQIGWNYQTGAWVFGAEAAFGLADVNAMTRCATLVFLCSTDIDQLGTFTGRLGFAFDQFLLYAKAGAAFERARYNITPYGGFGNPPALNGRSGNWGSIVGGGVEFAFNPALSAFAEFDVLVFGTRNVLLIDQSGNANNARAKRSEQVQLLKVGLNYKIGEAFGPWIMGSGARPFPQLPAPAWSWTGVYLGGQLGGGWGRTEWNGSGSANGFVLGGQIGANYQIGAWVTGVEAEAGWSDPDSNVKCPTGRAASFICHTRIGALGTFTPRLGVAIGNLLAYAKGGAAWDTETHWGDAGDGVRFTGSGSRWGWTAGAGLEYAFTPVWSGKVEYDYLNFANATLTLNDGLGNASSFVASQRLSVVKMGLNYKLGADPAARADTASLPMWVKAPVLKAPPPSDWTIEAGARYWVSSGRWQLDLGGASYADILSRLSYERVTGQAAESFTRLDHRDGMFVKGNFGLGDLAKGQFYDEDFGPFTLPYSDTVSVQRDGRMLYGSLDVGHAVISGPGGDIGAYVGYRYLYERQNAFGITQLATNRDVGGTSPSPISVLVISETEAWNGAAVGLNSRVKLADRWRLELDAALLPYLGFWSLDNHWLRPEFNPQPSQGQGWGSQFEAILSYALTDQWSIGAGGRYWYFATSSAHTQSGSPIKFYSERYGGFLQATYKFGASPAASAAISSRPSTPAAPRTWTGFYAGANLGVGFGRANWSDPFAPTSIGDQDQVGGALAGGQVGANYQIGQVVYGLEAAGSWAQLTGTATCFAGNPNQAIAGQDCGTKVGALATLAGRLGYAIDRTLYYAKAGPAWGHSTFQLGFAGAARPGQITTTAADRPGFTIGGGIEQALTREWSVVGEYKYVDLGSANVGFSGVPAGIAPVASEIINQRYQVVTLGLNYKLNWMEHSGPARGEPR